eukprot:scaffold12784_cov31-Tisochrysis_lutea.AAC.1
MFEGYSHNRRDETATPLCGTHRVGTKNALLQKPQLGCVRGSSYELPEDFQYTYGMAMVRCSTATRRVPPRASAAVVASTRGGCRPWGGGGADPCRCPSCGLQCGGVPLATNSSR